MHRIYRNYSVSSEIFVVLTKWQKLLQTCPECHVREVTEETFLIIQRIPAKEAREYCGELSWSPAQHGHAKWIIIKDINNDTMSSKNFAKVTEGEFRRAMNSSNNWRGPSFDWGQNFSYKNSASFWHIIINQFFRRSGEFSPFLTAGITYHSLKGIGCKHNTDYLLVNPLRIHSVNYRSGWIHVQFDTNSALSEE